MAEALGLAASIIQVAGTGLSVSKALYEYVDGVATADKRIRKIAQEIEFTSVVIEELGSIFQHDETKKIISTNAVKTANQTMEECSSIFAEIEATLKKSKRNTFGRLMLPFRDHKIELLRSHIDKLKSSLQLLISVLNHAHQLALKSDREAERQQREEIKELLEYQKRSTKKYEESLVAFSISDGSATLNEDDLEKEHEGKISVSASTTSNDNLEKESENKIPVTLCSFVAGNEISAAVKSATPQNDVSVSTRNIQTDNDIPVSACNLIPENDVSHSASTLAPLAKSISSNLSADTLAACVQHVKSLLRDVEALQQAFADQVDGDHDTHHSSVQVSYSTARVHLESMLFGTSTEELEFEAAKQASRQVNGSKSMADGIFSNSVSRSSTLLDVAIPGMKIRKKSKKAKAGSVTAEKVAEQENAEIEMDKKTGLSKATENLEPNQPNSIREGNNAEYKSFIADDEDSDSFVSADEGDAEIQLAPQLVEHDEKKIEKLKYDENDIASIDSKTLAGIYKSAAAMVQEQGEPLATLANESGSSAVSNHIDLSSRSQGLWHSVFGWLPNPFKAREEVSMEEDSYLGSNEVDKVPSSIEESKMTETSPQQLADLISPAKTDIPKATPSWLDVVMSAPSLLDLADSSPIIAKEVKTSNQPFAAAGVREMSGLLFSHQDVITEEDMFLKAVRPHCGPLKKGVILRRRHPSHLDKRRPSSAATGERRNRVDATVNLSSQHLKSVTGVNETGKDRSDSRTRDDAEEEDSDETIAMMETKLKKKQEERRRRIRENRAAETQTTTRSKLSVVPEEEQYDGGDDFIDYDDEDVLSKSKDKRVHTSETSSTVSKINWDVITAERRREMEIRNKTEQDDMRNKVERKRRMKKAEDKSAEGESDSNKSLETEELDARLSTARHSALASLSIGQSLGVDYLGSPSNQPISPASATKSAAASPNPNTCVFRDLQIENEVDFGDFGDDESEDEELKYIEDHNRDIKPVDIGAALSMSLMAPYIAPNFPANGYSLETPLPAANSWTSNTQDPQYLVSPNESTTIPQSNNIRVHSAQIPSHHPPTQADLLLLSEKRPYARAGGANYVPPSCEDYDSGDDDETDGYSRLSRADADPSTKRSHPSDLDKEKPPAELNPVNVELRSDSGYSSFPAATITDPIPSAITQQSQPQAPASIVSNTAIPPQSPAHKPRRPTFSNTNSSTGSRPSCATSWRRPTPSRRPTIIRDHPEEGECDDPNCVDCNAVPNRRRSEQTPPTPGPSQEIVKLEQEMEEQKEMAEQVQGGIKENIVKMEKERKSLGEEIEGREKEQGQSADTKTEEKEAQIFQVEPMRKENKKSLALAAGQTEADEEERILANFTSVPRGRYGGFGFGFDDNDDDEALKYSSMGKEVEHKDENADEDDNEDAAPLLPKEKSGEQDEDEDEDEVDDLLREWTTILW